VANLHLSLSFYLGIITQDDLEKLRSFARFKELAGGASLDVVLLGQSHLNLARKLSEIADCPFSKCLSLSAI
jgi:hypothetical protein